MKCAFIACLLVLTACAADDLNEHLENARFSLDKGEFAAAAAEIDAAYAINPQNEEVVLVRASAYAGKAGVDLLELGKKLVDTANESTAFKTIHDTLVGLIGSGGLDHLRTAVVTLSGYVAAVGQANVLNKTDVYGNLGVLQSIEGFALSTIAAQPATGGTITSADISGAHHSTTENDFLSADNNLLIAGYPTTNQLLKTVRKNYCVLKNVSANGTFSLAELRDSTLCQLHPTPSSLTSFSSGDVTSCSAAFVFGNCDGTTATE